MKQIKIHDKNFRIFITYEQISAVVENMAEKMNHDFAGRNPLFICILNGAFMFAAELFKRIDLTEAEITFVKLASYQGDKTTGNVKHLIGLNEKIDGRTVVVLEDIVDSGLTISSINDTLQKLNPLEVLFATLLLKPNSLKEKVHLDYVGMEIPDDFILGYGLDYNGHGRNFKDIYSVIDE